MTDGVVCELGLRSYTGRSSGDTKQSPKVESWASITKFSSILNCLAWVAMAAAKKKETAPPQARIAVQQLQELRRPCTRSFCGATLSRSGSGALLELAKARDCPSLLEKD